MAHEGEILVDPSARDLDTALRDSAQRIRSRLAEGESLSVPNSAAEELLARIGSEAEGWREIARLEGGWRFSTVASLAAVWWTDHLGRKHVGLSESPGDGSIGTPSPSRPPLASLYPQVA